VSKLLDAVYSGRHDEVAAILAGRPALDIFEAAAVGDVARVRELIDGDRALVNACAPDGFHPLGLAAFFRNGGVVDLLIDRGANVSAPAQNKLAVTALHSAVASDAAPVDHTIVRMLLEAGAPVNVPHLGGGTPLHTAAFTGDVESVRMLLEHGADPTLRLDDGKNAVDVARERGHEEAARMLERANARP
jgi:ankyrin repeat protein